MSPEVLNQVMPRSLIFPQPKVLDLLIHLSGMSKENLSSLIHFASFCGLDCLPRLNIYMSVVLTCCELGGCSEWFSLSVAVENEFSVGRADTENGHLHCLCAADSLQVVTFDFPIEKCAITESWLWRLLHSLPYTKFGRASLSYKLSDCIR